MGEPEPFISEEELLEIRNIFAPIEKLRVPPDFEDRLFARLGLSQEIEVGVPQETLPLLSLPPQPLLRRKTAWREIWEKSTRAMQSWLGSLQPAPRGSEVNIALRGETRERDALLEQGDRYAQEGQYRPAMETYEQYIQSDNLSRERIAAGLCRMAAVHYHTYRHEEAYEAASAAILLSPLRACAYWYRGAAAYMLDRDKDQHRKDRARRNWQRALNLEPDDGDTKRSLDALESSPEHFWRPERENPCEFL